MTRDELLALIDKVQHHQCEFDEVEVKAAASGVPRVRESLSAFANHSGGGILLFGLDERSNFAVVGVNNAQQIQEQIANQADNEMEPPLRPTCTIEDIDGMTVVSVEVPEVAMEQKPCYYRPAGLQGGSYIRVGGTDRRMTNYEIFSYASARVQPRDDEQPVPDATIDDLDRTRLDSYLVQLRQARPNAAYLNEPFERILERLRIVRTVDGVARPTLAGLLVFGTYPELFERQLVITFLQYYGETEDEKTPLGDRFLDNQMFEGPIPNMVDAALKHILANLRKSSRIEGILRQDIPEYPVEAIREAIVNAVAHRDYSHFVRGSHIRIRLFANRLEIQSPGGLYGGVTVQTLRQSQSTRNLLLVRLLEDLHVVENRGSGIRTMVNAMLEAKLDEPQFQDRRTAFVVTFSNASLLDPETITWLSQFANANLSRPQRYALAYLRHRGAMTNEEYRAMNRIDYADAHRDLRGLEVAGWVEARGVGSSASYVLKISTAIPTAPTPEPSEEGPQSAEEKVLAFVRANGSINNEQGRDILGVQDRRARAVLNQMVQEGLLHRLNAGPATRYVLP